MEQPVQSVHRSVFRYRSTISRSSNVTGKSNPTIEGKGQRNRRSVKAPLSTGPVHTTNETNVRRLLLERGTASQDKKGARDYTV